jgi:hypothetical protein
MCLLYGQNRSIEERGQVLICHLLTFGYGKIPLLFKQKTAISRLILSFTDGDNKQ